MQPGPTRKLSTKHDAVPFENHPACGGCLLFTSEPCSCDLCVQDEYPAPIGSCLVDDIAAARLHVARGDRFQRVEFSGLDEDISPEPCQRRGTFEEPKAPLVRDSDSPEDRAAFWRHARGLRGSRSPSEGDVL